MNILLNRLPESLTIDEIDYVINTDFRIGIQFEMLMMDNSISYMDKIVQALRLYYEEYPMDIQKAIDKILWFYSCNITSSPITKHKSSGESEQQMFCYKQDQYLIYTAFLLYYHIDLNTVEHLHWWKFKQLLNELPDEAKIKKVMMYRTIKINSNMSKEQKQFYAEMKVVYRLEDHRTEKQKANTFASILAGGMHIAKEVIGNETS